MNYFFSTTNGNDAYTPLQAQQPTTPWRTIERVNSHTLLNGDVLNFRCGETFPGILKINKNIEIHPYTSGKLPVLNVPVIADGVSVNISGITLKKL